MKAALKFIGEYKGSPVLYLSDFRNVITSCDVTDFAKSAENQKGMKKLTKSAVLGISGIKKMLLNTVNTLTGNKVRACDTEEEGMEFLANKIER